MKGVHACEGPFFTTVRPRLPLRLAALLHRASCRRRRSAQTAAAGSNGIPPGQASQNGASPSGLSGDDSAFEVKDKNGGSLDVRIMSGEFTDDGSTKERITRPIRKVLAKDRGGPGARAARHMMQDCKSNLVLHVPAMYGCTVAKGCPSQVCAVCGGEMRGTHVTSQHWLSLLCVASLLAYAAGRALSYALAKEGQKWRAAAAARMPEARGDVRQIVGQPVFVPLYKLFLTYGKVSSWLCRSKATSTGSAGAKWLSRRSQVFRLSFGPKSFVVVSDAEVARHILLTNAGNYSKGLLSEILDFVMGTGARSAAPAGHQPPGAVRCSTNAAPPCRAHTSGWRDLEVAPAGHSALPAPQVHRVHGGHVRGQRTARRPNAAGGCAGAPWLNLCYAFGMPDVFTKSNLYFAVLPSKRNNSLRDASCRPHMRHGCGCPVQHQGLRPGGQ